MTVCSKCGDCCDHIWMTAEALERIETRAKYIAWEGASVDDLVTRCGWERESAELWLGNERENVNAPFIAAHWHAIETNERGSYHSCDQFDPALRLCMAHDDRPPICRGYPWYGQDPAVVVEKEKGRFSLSPRCSFLEDVPVAFRAAVARPS